MLLDEQFDADEVLRDVHDDNYVEDEVLTEEEIREVEFGNVHTENANFSEMASDIDSTDDLWE